MNVRLYRLGPTAAASGNQAQCAARDTRHGQDTLQCFSVVTILGDAH